MKFSISLPSAMGQEIKSIASQSQKNVSWVIQTAWRISRTRLCLDIQHDEIRRKKSLKNLSSLRGVLKKDFPHVDSVALSHQAFL